MESLSHHILLDLNSMGMLLSMGCIVWPGLLWCWSVWLRNYTGVPWCQIPYSFGSSANPLWPLSVTTSWTMPQCKMMCLKSMQNMTSSRFCWSCDSMSHDFPFLFSSHLFWHLSFRKSDYVIISSKSPFWELFFDYVIFPFPAYFLFWHSHDFSHTP